MPDVNAVNFQLEILVNSFVVSSVIYHVCVLCGWTLVIFSLLDGHNSHCPIQPLLLFYIHGLSLISVLGLIAWLVTGLFDLSLVLNSVVLPRWSCTGFSSCWPSWLPSRPRPSHSDSDEWFHDSATDLAITEPRELRAENLTFQNAHLTLRDDSQRADLQRALQNLYISSTSPSWRSYLTLGRLIFLLFLLAHLILWCTGAWVTVPMFFKMELYSKGLLDNECNIAMYWFSFLINLVALLMFSTLVICFFMDSSKNVKRINESIQIEVHPADDL